jgi:hypothetical protein
MQINNNLSDVSKQNINNYKNRLNDKLNELAAKNALCLKINPSKAIQDLRKELIMSGISRTMLLRYMNNDIQPNVETANNIVVILNKYEPNIKMSDIF